MTCPRSAETRSTADGWIYWKVDAFILCGRWFPDMRCEVWYYDQNNRAQGWNPYRLDYPSWSYQFRIVRPVVRVGGIGKRVLMTDNNPSDYDQDDRWACRQLIEQHYGEGVIL